MRCLIPGARGSGLAGELLLCSEARWPQAKTAGMPSGSGGGSSQPSPQDSGGGVGGSSWRADPGFWGVS